MSPGMSPGMRFGRPAQPAHAFLLALLCLPWWWSYSVAESAVVTTESIQCTYDPDSGQPNPFGSRAFITVIQNGADTLFRYEHFPSLVQVASQGTTAKKRAITVSNKRTMIFYNTDIEVARELMRIHNEYYFELIGYEDQAGFSSYDEAMTCV